MAAAKPKAETKRKAAAKPKAEAKAEVAATDTITWKRPSGTTIETNASRETVEYCTSLGWEQV